MHQETVLVAFTSIRVADLVITAGLAMHAKLPPVSAPSRADLHFNRPPIGRPQAIADFHRHFIWTAPRANVCNLLSEPGRARSTNSIIQHGKGCTQGAFRVRTLLASPT